MSPLSEALADVRAYQAKRRAGPAPMYFVLADYGALGRRWVDRDPNDTDRETTIRDLIDLQIERPLRVIEVIPDEGTSRDVSEDIARTIAAIREPLYPALIKFIERHAGAALANELQEA